MMDRLNLTARRDGTDFRLFCNGFEFGRLSDCEVSHVYEGALSDVISAGWQGDYSPREMLAHVRRAIEDVLRSPKGEFSPEQYAAEGMRIREAAKALKLNATAKEGQSMVDQACHVMRTRPY